jgi:hypothetical protein
MSDTIREKQAEIITYLKHFIYLEFKEDEDKFNKLESELSALLEAEKIEKCHAIYKAVKEAWTPEKQEPEENLSEDDIWKNLFNDLSIPDFYWDDILSGYKKKYKLTVNSLSKQKKSPIQRTICADCGAIGGNEATHDCHKSFEPKSIFIRRRTKNGSQRNHGSCI